LEIVEAIAGWGADLGRTVMSHIERTVFDPATLRELAATGVYMEYDLFGHDSSYYPFAPETYMPGDHERIAQIEGLAADGRLDRVLMSHDVCSKHRLKAYGGHGWDHILNRVLPRMRARGFSEKDLRTLLVDNPTRLLTFV
ncbi:MAG: aryldialkylphosphatase, partial [Gemmatimonadetes bacterium]|nr:aryldialkylphosphatase [Gemmatimonadota bacterium]